jgi:hypothetical protein
MQAVYPEDLARYLETYLDVVSRRKRFEAVFRLRHWSGEYRWVVGIGKPFYDPDNHFAGYIGTCVDITERIRAEERVRRQKILELPVERHGPEGPTESWRQTRMPRRANPCIRPLRTISNSILV